MFDGLVALAEGEAEVVEGDVFVEVDELGFGAGEVARGVASRAGWKLAWTRWLRGTSRSLPLEQAGGRGGGGTGLCALAKGVGKIQARPATAPAGWMPLAPRLGAKAASVGSHSDGPLAWAWRWRAGAKPPETPRRSHSTVPRGAPSTRAKLSGGDAATAMGMADNRARMDRDALRSGFGWKIAVGLGTHVGDGGNGDSGIGEVEGGAVGGVVVGEEDRAGARGHGVAIHVGGNGTGQHDAGAVVVGEEQGAFVGTGGEDDLFGQDAPDAAAAFSEPAVIRLVGDEALGEQDEVALVEAEGGGVGEGG